MKTAQRKTLSAFGLIATAAVVPLLVYTIEDTRTRAASARMSAVGGLETFRAQRLEHLIRLRENVHVSDPEVRAREIAEIDAQIEELRRGAETVEMGTEMRIERQVR